MISYSLLDSAIDLVSYGYQEFSSWKSVKFIVNVSLNLRLIPNLELLSCIVDLSQKSVHIGASIKVSPQNFSVLRIIASSKVLFSSIVNNGNTNWGHTHSTTSSILLCFYYCTAKWILPSSMSSNLIFMIIIEFCRNESSSWGIFPWYSIRVFLTSPLQPFDSLIEKWSSVCVINFLYFFLWRKSTWRRLVDWKWWGIRDCGKFDVWRIEHQ